MDCITASYCLGLIFRFSTMIAVVHEMDALARRLWAKTGSLPPTLSLNTTSHTTHSAGELWNECMALIIFYCW
ncbi:MAG: hypothetical protein WBJ07_06710, partial [Limnochordia bacterium]